jgi:hypothetical protein
LSNKLFDFLSSGEAYKALDALPSNAPNFAPCAENLDMHLLGYLGYEFYGKTNIRAEHTKV